MTVRIPASLLKPVEAVARAAGRKLASGAAGLRTVNSAEAHDIKLQADIESEELIRGRLAGLADYPVIGEELGGDEDLPRRDEPYWVIDPLDGTHNYLRGNPQCCVSIGLMRGEEPLLGVIYDFNLDELFAALPAERRLTLDNEPVRPRWPAGIGDAVLMTGFPSGMDYGSEALAAFVSDVQRFKKIRMNGSAALAAAYVAVARADVYTETAIRLWDIAGALALLKAGGGAVKMTPNPTKPFAYDAWFAGRKEWLPR